MLIQDDSESHTVPLDLQGAWSILEEVGSLKQYCLAQGKTTWNPLLSSDQVADKFHQQTIAHEK